MRVACRVIAGCGLLGIIAVPPVWGHPHPVNLQDQDAVEKTLGRYGLHPVFEKFGRGVSNVLGGWLEIPLNIQTRYAEDDRMASLATGTLYGVVKGIVRTGVGVYETVTCFLPYPADFRPILPTIAYFRKKDRHQPLLWE